MTSIVFYFQVHQPFRLQNYRFFDIGHDSRYFDDAANRAILDRVADKCYLPMNRLLERLIEANDGRFRCSFSISGTALDQFDMWRPEVIESFQRLSATGCVEFLAETSHHSLTCLVDEHEFRAQVQTHCRRIDELFGQRPRVFRNTELVYSNEIAKKVERLGFDGILCEGADKILEWRSPHRVYGARGCERLKLLCKSYRLSDDIAFRFGDQKWQEWPLSAHRFAQWLHALPEDDRFVGLFMDYETFGEHQWPETGIFEFMEHLPETVLQHPRFRFETPAQVLAGSVAVAELDMPWPVSWADQERDLSAWLGSAIQRSAHEALCDLLPLARQQPSVEMSGLLDEWRKLSTSDNFYYMSSKTCDDGAVHSYFSPYDSPYDAFIAFMNVLRDLRLRMEKLAVVRVPERDDGSDLDPIRRADDRVPALEVAAEGA